ncbi:MAG TPA: zf-HC2 domain-containing protein [Pyrinomonadaceae bacterium]|jgi:hypothetical protein
MRCEDCLPLIEEYFDGEVEGAAAARMGAHLAACATCAAALDALSFEQEIYARYDRRLEVSPDLWSRVSAEIARDSRPETPAAPRPFLSRVRERLTSALGVFNARPAFASSLALALIAAALGSLWLARREQPVAPAEVASNERGHVAATPRPTADTTTGGDAGPAPVKASASSEGSLNDDAVEFVPAAYEPERGRQRESARGPRTVEILPGVVATEDEVQKLLATPSAPPANPNVVMIKADEHAETDEAASLFVNASAPAGDTADGDVRLLDPRNKEVARHVERAQMLLRSIKNARASEAGAVDVAYEKNLSRRLLAENATLQLEADVRGDRQTRQVLDTIEPFLLDIANMRENPSRDEVRSMRERVRKDEIVAALQVY